MIKALFTSATGMNAQQLVVDNTANNLANVNTTGFKRSQINFADLLYVTTQRPGTQATQNLQVPAGLQIGGGVRVADNTKVFIAGTEQNTNNQLDVAIEGDGFLKIQLPNNDLRYTRAGSLRMDSTGQLVTPDGNLLQPKISIPQDTTSIGIGTDGTVSVTTASSPNKPTIVGSITLTRFPNPAGLSSEGSNLFAETAASGAPQDGAPGVNGSGILRQGFLEGSNVDVVQELVNLIQAQRAYEFNTKAIQTSDQMLSDTNNLVR